MPVRALLRVCDVDNVAAPYNRMNLKIFYPADEASTLTHQQTAVLPFNQQWSKAPVVIFLPGVNCSPHTYEWLAIELGLHGIVTIIPTWIAQNLPGRISITPGVDIDAIQVDTYGQTPTCTSLPPIFRTLEELRHDPVLGQHLDYENVVLGGHSAGGTMAMQNARHDWFPCVQAAFAYAANPLATATLGGWGQGEIPPLPTEVPLLMMGGTYDGIGDHHVQAFGNAEESGTEYIQRLFTETEFTNSTLCIFDGANHHTICHPVDLSIGRVFLDTPTDADEDAIRQDMAQVIIRFINVHIKGDEYANNLLAERAKTAIHWKQV